MKKELDVARRIASKILTEDKTDDSVLQGWKELSESNQELLESLSDISVFAGKLRLYEDFDKSEGWKKLDGRMKQIRKRRFTRTGLSVAACAAMFILAFSMLLVSREKQLPEEQENAVSSLVNILPGTTKAVLTMEDGTVVELGSEMKELMIQGTKLSIDSSRVLKYDQTGSLPVTMQTLRVPSGGEYRLALSDGTEVWLNSGSEITFPSRFDKNNRSVSIKGEVCFHVMKEADRPFVVRFDTLNITVLGTMFNVYNYPHEDTKITLAEGAIVVGGMGKSKPVRLSPNEQLQINHQTGQTTILPIDPYGELAWTKGLLYFNNLKISEVMKRLERWYNVHIVIENDSLANKEIFGVIRKYEDFSQVADLFRMIKTFDFNINDNQILISNFK